MHIYIPKYIYIRTLTFIVLAAVLGVNKTSSSSSFSSNSSPSPYVA
jgi:hypothetical protein